MEPLSALSLVAAVIQFVDFGGNLLSESRQIYKSASGASSENAVLGEIYENLSRLADKMKVSSGLSAHTSSKEEEALGKLATSCKDIADDLMVTIEELKVKGDTHRKWKSFHSALKTIGKKSYIKELQKKLDKFSLQLTVQLAAIIRDQQSKLLGDISSLAQESRKMQTDHKNELEKITETLSYTRQSIGLTEYATLSQAQTTRLATVLGTATLAAEDMATEHKILKSLYFKTLTARHTNIAKAHEETFQWIFKRSSKSLSSKSGKSEICFVGWLRSDSGIYWVSGKPGSGKSTLMKYLSDNLEVQENLQVWAGDTKLVIVSFYFWNAGNLMQRSQEGLLRSLIFEILRKCPSLVKIVCPNRWDATERNTIYDTSWNLPELAQVMTNLSSQTSMPVKFCFFIDGLDEYEGDHHEVIEVLNAINSLSNIKICLSSRPWNVFEDAFGQDPTQKLYMQDLTRGDIEIYVRSKLEKHQAFRLRASGQADYENLIVRTVKKSNGVFLWVFLVVRSLLEGLTNEDSIQTLEARLENLPADLEDYFGHILEKVDMVYRRDMARTFQEALHATEPLTLIMLSYLDESDADYALRIDSAPMDHSDTFKRISQMRRRINSRCKGLLEPGFDHSASVFWGHKAEFLHRTVRDYLLTKDMQSMLDKYMGTGGSFFNANKSLCRGYLALIKCMPRVPEDISLLGVQIENLLYHARQAEKQTEMSDRELLDNLEWTTEDLISSHSCSPLQYKRNRFVRHSFSLSRNGASVFQLAITNGLDIYVAEMLSDGHSLGSALGFALHMYFTPAHGDFDNNSMVQLLLTRACHPDSSIYRSCFSTDRWAAYCNALWADWLLKVAKDYTAGVETKQQSAHRLQTLQILLHFGAQPNIIYHGGAGSVGPLTLWKELLKHINSLPILSAEESTYLYQILDVLITHGADPDVEVQGPYGRTITLQTVTAKFPLRLQNALLSRARQSKELAQRKLEPDRGSWDLWSSLLQCCGHRKRNAIVLPD